jgi:GTP-binding protein YchF
MDIGMIGLERSGKSALFAALTKGHARAGSFASAEPNIGSVKVPDERLDKLCVIIPPKKITYAEVRFLDFPGGFSVKGEGPAAAYLAALSQCDALAHVVRAYQDESVPHPSGGVDPEGDIEAINLELAFADSAMLGRRLEKLDIQARSVKAGERGAFEREQQLIERLRAGLDREEPLRAQEISEDEWRILSGYQLLTDKPLLIVVNIGEADVARAAEIEAQFADRWRARGVEVAAVCAKLEQELSELSDEEAEEFRRDLGVQESGLDRMMRLAHDALGLATFFTVGEPEGRAWPITAGSTALEAAGKIHSDIARGFIRAEVVGWQELLDCGSYAEARKRALLRTEGKQYIVQDGDVLHVLFNV